MAKHLHERPTRAEQSRTPQIIVRMVAALNDAHKAAESRRNPQPRFRDTYVAPALVVRATTERRTWGV